jgi:hypothetical protein
MGKPQREALNVQQSKSKGGNTRLVVISGRYEKDAKPSPISAALIVSQLRLAEIAELQSRIAYSKEQLSRAWASVREDLTKGASIESGPMRAWLESRIRVSRTGKKRKYTRTRLIVR